MKINLLIIFIANLYDMISSVKHKLKWFDPHSECQVILYLTGFHSIYYSKYFILCPPEQSYRLILGAF